ncbi:helix-turn-helix transcriptional regulator [Longispora sp. NPDC051575]|uniref:helix-turn-helix domain-containing protein n=1 Tax=Longispora sp. NPDC051575 TaxID=3154943 RepID=UPI00341791B1
MTDAFGAALRDAIRRSGLSLDEVARRLRARHTPVSASALSYWQTGATRPERTSSLAAVTELETLLGEPPGALAALIGPRRPRGRRPGGTPPADPLWTRPTALTRALDKLDAGLADLQHPVTVSQDLAYRIDGGGQEESVRVRRIVRAERDHTTRLLFVSRCGPLSRPPTVTYTEGCRPARFRADVPTATCVFEFLLDRPLRAGELAAVEFGLRFPPGQTDRHVVVAVPHPSRELVLRVTFAPGRLPASCHAYRQPGPDPAGRQRSGIALGGETAQSIVLDPAPGRYGIAWDW